MGVYNSNIPWSSKFAFQELSQEQTQLRRLELLLLNNSAGLFISHIKSNLNLPQDVIQQNLDQLAARNIDGFWVHPHYALNVPYRGLFPTPPQSKVVEVSAHKIVDRIREVPDISITALLRVAKINNPNDLIALLKNVIRPDIDVETQYLVGDYLYRRFNVHCRLAC